MTWIGTFLLIPFRSSTHLSCPSSRIREAAAVKGVEALVVACPKDVTMYQDAVKTTGYESKLQVKDLIELVHEAM